MIRYMVMRLVDDLSLSKFEPGEKDVNISLPRGSLVEAARWMLFDHTRSVDVARRHEEAFAADVLAAINARASRMRTVRADEIQRWLDARERVAERTPQ